MSGSRESLRILVTAGPTQEPIDAVRFLGNRSSGRMGLALAEAVAARGWPCTLLLGPTPREPGPGSKIRVRRFRTTADLEALLREEWPEHDVLLMAAAVADFRPAVRDPQAKLRRTGERVWLELEPTPDLLVGIRACSRPDQTVVGFALEPPQRLLECAREKLLRKGLDAIVANPLQTMDALDVSATVLLSSGRTLHPASALPKAEFAEWLLGQLPVIRGLAPLADGTAAPGSAGPDQKG